VCPIHRWTTTSRASSWARRTSRQAVPELGRTPLSNWNGLLFDGKRDVGRDLAALGVRDFDFSGYMLDRVEMHRVNYNWNPSSRCTSRTITSARSIRPRTVRHVRGPRVGVRDWASVQTVGINNRLAKPGSRIYERCTRRSSISIAARSRGRARLAHLLPEHHARVVSHVLVISTLYPEAVDRTMNVVEFYYPRRSR